MLLKGERRRHDDSKGIEIVQHFACEFVLYRVYCHGHFVLVLPWQYVLGTLLAINILVRVGTALFFDYQLPPSPMSATPMSATPMLVWSSYLHKLQYT